MSLLFKGDFIARAIFFFKSYVIALNLPILELKKLSKSDLWLPRYLMKAWEINNSENNFLFISFIFSKSSCQYGGNMNKIEKYRLQ